MGNKSPQKSSPKKAGKSIKEKRAEKRQSSGSVQGTSPIVPPKKD